MAKSGPESPPRPAQQAFAEPGAKSSFDGEESTEVMDVPIAPVAPKAAPAPVEVLQDVEEKDKKYIAPRVIPAAAVPDKADAAKIVLNIPDARTDRAPPAPPLKRGAEVVAGDKPAVAEVRARRRAATVKIARPNLSALSQAADESIDVALEDDFEPPPPLEAPAQDAAPLVASRGLVQAVPIGLTPAAPPAVASTAAAGGRSSASLASPRPSGPHEAPATAIAIQESARAEKSRLPWVLFGALTLGAAAAGVFVATRKPDAGFASKAPAAAQQTATSGAPTQAPTAEVAPTPTVAVTATAELTTSVADTGAASAAPTVTATTPATQALASPPPTATFPKTAGQPPAYTVPRPTATFPRPPPKKTNDIPSGI